MPHKRNDDQFPGSESRIFEAISDVTFGAAALHGNVAGMPATRS
jgi:hypothetical protein